MITWYVKELTTGLKAAQGSAPDFDTSMAECTRYAMQYSEEGPVEYCVKDGRKILFKDTIE